MSNPRIRLIFVGVMLHLQCKPTFYFAFLVLRLGTGHQQTHPLSRFCAIIPFLQCWDHKMKSRCSSWKSESPTSNAGCLAQFGLPAKRCLRYFEGRAAGIWMSLTPSKSFKGWAVIKFSILSAFCLAKRVELPDSQCMLPGQMHLVGGHKGIPWW